MIKKLFVLLAALMLATMAVPPALAVGTMYNQTYTDDDNTATWEAITAGYYTYWVVKGGAQVMVINTSTTASPNGINVTVHSGPFFRGSLGDQVYTLSSNKTYILGPFDMSRFKQANETLLVQSNASRGKVFAISIVS